MAGYCFTGVFKIALISCFFFSFFFKRSSLGRGTGKAVLGEKVLSKRCWRRGTGEEVLAKTDAMRRDNGEKVLAKTGSRRKGAGKDRY